MSKHDVELKIVRDADGHIISAGARWAEARPVIEHMLRVMAVGSVFASALGFLCLAVAGMNPLLVLGLLGLLVSLVLLFDMPGEPRGVYFQADGGMQTPYGLCHRPNLPAIGGNHNSLVSIEARMQRDQPSQRGERLFELVMLSKGGDLILVSRSLHEWVALKAAAQLTHALLAIRTEQADTPFGGAWVEYS